MSSSLPPAMIVSVPSSAFGAEPVTGASTKPWPCSRSVAPSRRASAGAIVEQSMNSVPSGGAGDRAVLAQQHRLDLRAVDHHRDHGVGALGGRARAVGDLGLVLGGPGLGGLARPVEDAQLVAGADEVRRLARAHDAEADEADAHRRQA